LRDIHISRGRLAYTPGTSAAVDGLEIAYTIDSMAGPFLRSGQLVRILEEWPMSIASENPFAAAG
jgi:hypothetical protein